MYGNSLESRSRLKFSILSLDLELVPKRPMSHSFRPEASTYGLACSGDGDNREAYHITVCCFSLENVVYL